MDVGSIWADTIIDDGADEMQILSRRRLQCYAVETALRKQLVEAERNTQHVLRQIHNLCKGRNGNEC